MIEHDDTGCRFLVGAGYCCASTKPGSSYCPDHHAQCYLQRGSKAEKNEQRHFNALAKCGPKFVIRNRPPGSVLSNDRIRA